MGRTSGGSAGGGSLTVIKQQVLTVAAATVTFSSIPATYEDLIISVFGAVDDAAVAASIKMQFNADTAAHYSDAGAEVQNATVNADQEDAVTSAWVGRLPGNSTANASGSLQITVSSYARTGLWRAYTMVGGAYRATNAYWDSFAGNWQNTADAITSVELIDSGGGNFIVGSVFTLYGRSG